MENWSDWIYDSLGMSHSLQNKIIATIALALILFIARRLILHFVLRNVKDVKIRYTWTKSLTYTNYILFVLFAAPIWFTALQSMGTFLGLLSAGLAVALKDPISNLFAWVYILFKKPFVMGDRIQIDNSEGDIIDIGFFEFTMMEIKNWVAADQSTGRIVHIPNGLLFTRPVVNYNQAMNYIWNEIPILITFESNWQKAKQILLDIEEIKLKEKPEQIQPELEKGMKNYHVTYKNLDPTVYTSLRPNGISLTLRYLCPPKKRRGTEQLAIEEILSEFAKHGDIQFAYPTTRFYDATKERKTVTGTGFFDSGEQ
jgi:small-conductance mechanosensitive channel